MGKKPVRPMHLELKLRLDQQDDAMKKLHNDQVHVLKTMNQVLDLLKGSSMMNTKGLIEDFRKFEEDLSKGLAQMAHIERWRQVQIAKKGTFTFKTANLLTQCLSIIGAAGTLAAIVYTVIKIVEEVNK